jgi:glutamate carboxypeptidase
MVFISEGMEMKTLFEKIDALNAQYIQIWQDLCNNETPGEQKARVDQAGKYIADWAQAKGWQVHIEPMEGAGDIVWITLNPEAQGQGIFLSGHLDTVHPVGTFGNPPVRIEGDTIYGPGVTDCKGGIVGAMLAMEALDQINYRGRKIHLLLQTDEEGSSDLSKKATINYMCKVAQGAKAFLNLEGQNGNTAVLKRKGILSVYLDIKGEEAHASQCAILGANAIAEAAHKILELEKLKDHDGLTASCDLIEGGSVINTVAGHCRFGVNIRFATNAQRDWVLEYLQKIADTTYIEGCKTELIIAQTRPAMEEEQRNYDLLDRMNRCYAACGLPILSTVIGIGGSDAAEVTESGTPCIDSIGVEGEDIHNPNERARISSLAECAKRLAAFCCYEE